MELIIGLVVIVSTIWMAMDSSKNQITTDGKAYAFGNGAFVWVIAAVLLWILAFPYYLYKRGQQMRHRHPGVIMSSGPAYSEADELLKYKKLLDAGAITHAEYEEKKRQVLG